MTTPVLQSKTWQYAVNASVRTPASVADAASYQKWFICSLLLGKVAMTDFDNVAIAEGALLGKWSIYSTCDSVTAGVANDGVDHLSISGAYDAAKWVRAAEGVAHSNAVLKSPAGMGGGPWYFCINDAGGSANQINYVISKSPFSTGGTVTNRPTAANECEAINRVITHATVFTQGRMRATLCTDGNFVIQHNIDGNGFFDYFLAGCSLAETLGVDEAHNFWLLNDFQTSSPGSPHMQNWQSFGTLAILGRGPAGAVLTGGATIEEPYAGGASVYGSVVTGKDATNNKFRNRQAVIITQNPNSERGVLADITLCPQGVAAWLNGSFVPDTGVDQFREFMRSGHFLLPANGVTQTL